MSWDLRRDMIHAWRGLRRSPGFALVAITVLALGFGANTAIFSLFNAALLAPPPGIADPGRMASLFRIQNGQLLDTFDFPNYLDFRDRSHSVSGLAAHCGARMILHAESVDRVRGDLVTGNYFPVLGVRPRLGRLISTEDDGPPNSNPVAVLSDGLWRRAFGADPTVVGRNIELNGSPFQVIGVAQRDFEGTITGVPIDLWVPMSMLDEAMPRVRGHNFFTERAAGWLMLLGRLKPGVRVEQAEGEFKLIASQLALQYPQENSARTLTLTPGIGVDPDDRASLGRLFALLFAAAGLLLLLACANLASLLLTRATARQHEIAICQALGASRRGLVTALLAEGLLLSAVASAAGLLIARIIITLTAHYREHSFVLSGLNAGIDPRVLGFTALLCVGATLLFAMAPAWSSTKSDLTDALKERLPGNRRRRSRAQGALVCAQVAMSLVLLIASGLVLRTMRNIVSANPGYRTDHLALLTMDLTTQDYSETAGKELYQRVLERVHSLAGVEAAALATSIPPTEWNSRVSIFYPGQEPPPDQLRGREFEQGFGIRVSLNVVSPDYFATMGIPLLRGRDFRLGDRRGSGGVAILSRGLAERLWPGASALGKRISWPTLTGPARPPLEVVGVVGDVRLPSLVSDPPPVLYVPILQEYDGRATLVIRTAVDPVGILNPIGRAGHDLDAGLILFQQQTMREHVGASLWLQEMITSLIGGFGLLALALAALALYGVVAYSVSQRTREVGIRIALGAEPRNVLALIVREGMAFTALGIVVGLGAALGLTRLLASFLYNVGPTDLAAFASATAVLIAVQLLASYLPARRAAKVDPVVALRDE